MARWVGPVWQLMAQWVVWYCSTFPPGHGGRGGGACCSWRARRAVESPVILGSRPKRLCLTRARHSPQPRPVWGLTQVAHGHLRSHAQGSLGCPDEPGFVQARRLCMKPLVWEGPASRYTITVGRVVAPQRQGRVVGASPRQLRFAEVEVVGWSAEVCPGAAAARAASTGVRHPASFASLRPRWWDGAPRRCLWGGRLGGPPLRA